MKIDREQLLKALTVASVGCTKKEILEQSNAYIFAGTDLISYNGEVFTKTTNPLPDIEGAVPAEELHKIISKFPDAEVDVSIHKKQLKIEGKKRAAGITLQKKIALPYEDVPAPEKWKRAPEKLSGILLQASWFCGTDETMPATSAVHVAPTLVESCDSKRLFRYEMETGFKRDTLIPATSLGSMGGLVVEKVSQSKGWVHFMLPDDHLVSIRTVSGEYPNLTPLLEVKKPQKVKLPPNLDDILSRAEVMQEAAFEASVHVVIESNKLTLRAERESGWFRETKKVDYDGKRLAFHVHPKFLSEVFDKKGTVLVGGNRMKLKHKEAIFVISLEVEKEDEGAGEEE